MTGTFMLLLALAAADPQAGATPTATTKTAPAEEKMICKKFLDTGSLVKSTRVCKTKAEWDHDRANVRAGFNSAASCRENNGTSCF